MIRRWTTFAALILALPLGIGAAMPRTGFAQQVEDPPERGKSAPAPPVDPLDRPLPPDLETKPAKRPAAPLDEEVVPVEGSGGDGNPLAPAKERPGGGSEPAGAPADPAILPADRLPIGPSNAAIKVEVEGPSAANLNRQATFVIRITNIGSTAASGVKIYDKLPAGLRFDQADPKEDKVVGDNTLFWTLNTLGAGVERRITIKATPTQKGNCDHAPTVTLSTGSRSRTQVKEPKLKVEVTQTEHGEILKGKAVTFSVRVTNLGDGPARNVRVQATLSQGLKQEYGHDVAVDFAKDLNKPSLAPGESEILPLEVDAAAEGDQTVDVVATSPDVAESADAKGQGKISVVAPIVGVKVQGGEKRYTDQTAKYTIIVTNSGKAPATNVRSKIELSSGGQLVRVPQGIKAYSGESGSYFWPIGEIEPGGQRELPLDVRLGGVGIFKIVGWSQADLCPKESNTFQTQVTGIANLKCDLTDSKSYLDIGDETVYEIRIKNVGTKETDVLVNGQLSDNLEIVETDGLRAKGRSPEGHSAVFPSFNLDPGTDQVLSIRAKATKEGTGTCTVKINYGESVFSQTLSTRILPVK